jgi:hypothetical protein
VFARDGGELSMISAVAVAVAVSSVAGPVMSCSVVAMMMWRAVSSLSRSVLARVC